MGARWSAPSTGPWTSSASSTTSAIVCSPSTARARPSSSPSTSSIPRASARRRARPGSWRCASGCRSMRGVRRAGETSLRSTLAAARGALTASPREREAAGGSGPASSSSGACALGAIVRVSQHLLQPRGSNVGPTPSGRGKTDVRPRAPGGGNPLALELCLPCAEAGVGPVRGDEQDLDVDALRRQDPCRRGRQHHGHDHGQSRCCHERREAARSSDKRPANMYFTDLRENPVA